MRKLLPLIIIIISSSSLSAQKVDSIFLNLYTDSLKKGQHNYINVDGKLSNGRWMPLSSKEIEFSSPDAKFEGNELILPPDFAPLKVSVRVVLKGNPSLWLERTIWVKQKPDPELPTEQEVIKSKKRSKNKDGSQLP